MEQSLSLSLSLSLSFYCARVPTLLLQIVPLSLNFVTRAKLRKFFITLRVKDVHDAEITRQAKEINNYKQSLKMSFKEMSKQRLRKCFYNLYLLLIIYASICGLNPLQCYFQHRCIFFSLL